MADILYAKQNEEFKDCVEENASTSTLATDETHTKPALDDASLDQLHELSLSDKDGRIHPSLQLVSTALAQGYLSSELTDVVPVPKTTKKPENTKDDKVNQTDGESKSANTIIINAVDLKSVGENTLKPREQEKEDEAVLRGLRHLFNNRFMSAKTLFEQRADRDPLYALALSSMAFLKAVMVKEKDNLMALNALNATFSIAKAQIDAAKKTSKVSGYFSGYYSYLKRDKSQNHQTNPPPNGVLRAHVVKAECCLLIAVLQLLQESVMGYIKCGLNLRRAYSSYNFVWQKYKALESNYAAFMDSDTVSGVQFGIGSVHLVLSALPAKILKAISAFGWKPDKELGFSLLNICVESKRVRSPMATVMLLAYYSAAMSFAPQILCDAYTKTAMETLLEAQRYYPNAALYLFFAGRISRLAFDLPLSTQSYLYAAEMTKNDWAEIPVANACRYEIAMNHMITGNWEHAASSFEYLYQQKYWSAAFCKYMQGACLEMMGKRTDAILAFAEVPALVVKKLGGRMSDIDAYVLRKVQTFQASGYQDLDFYTPALEFMCIWNLLYYMDKAKLEECRKLVERALLAVASREKDEYDIRSQELAPETPPPDHFDKRAALFLIKAALQNAAGVAADNTVILNWIIDHKESFSSDPWVIPYALWEAGVTCWHTGQRNRSHHVWNLALGYSSYDFEYRLAVRLNLALSYAEEQGFSDPPPQPVDDKKRFSISLTSK